MDITRSYCLLFQQHTLGLRRSITLVTPNKHCWSPVRYKKSKRHIYVYICYRPIGINICFKLGDKNTYYVACSRMVTVIVRTLPDLTQSTDDSPMPHMYGERLK